MTSIRNHGALTGAELKEEAEKQEKQNKK